MKKIQVELCEDSAQIILRALENYQLYLKQEGERLNKKRIKEKNPRKLNDIQFNIDELDAVTLDVIQATVNYRYQLGR